MWTSMFRAYNICIDMIVIVLTLKQLVIDHLCTTIKYMYKYNNRSMDSIITKTACDQLYPNHDHVKNIFITRIFDVSTVLLIFHQLEVFRNGVVLLMRSRCFWMKCCRAGTPLWYLFETMAVPSSSFFVIYDLLASLFWEPFDFFFRNIFFALCDFKIDGDAATCHLTKWKKSIDLFLNYCQLFNANYIVLIFIKIKNNNQTEERWSKIENDDWERRNQWRFVVDVAAEMFLNISRSVYAYIYGLLV